MRGGFVSVRDHGIEGLRKSISPVTPGDNSEYYVLTKIVDAITGSFSPSGLTKEFKNTTMLVGDVATKIPATPLTDRNAMAIYNGHATKTLYIGNSNVTADTVVGTTSGWKIDAGSYLQLDIKETIEMYAIYEGGVSAMVQIMEVA